MMDTMNETFMMQLTIRKQEEIPVYSEKQAQIKAKAQMETTGHSKA